MFYFQFYISLQFYVITAIVTNYTSFLAELSPQLPYYDDEISSKIELQQTKDNDIFVYVTVDQLNSLPFSQKFLFIINTIDDLFSEFQVISHKCPFRQNHF